MPPPAACSNCANDSSSAPPAQQQANVGVVLGVLGGLCLVAIVVVVVVPLVRRRVRRREPVLPSPSSNHSYRKARTSDIEDEMYLPSRRPSFLHQKMFPGPDGKPLLKPLILDPLRPISALTWSDLRSGANSPSSSTDPGSDELAHPHSHLHLHRGIPDPADQASLQTDRAQTSHRTMSKSTKSSYGTAGAIEDEARSSLPSLQRSPTPPGLPSKRGSPAVPSRRASLPITPISPPDSNPSPSRYGSGPAPSVHRQQARIASRGAAAMRHRFPARAAAWNLSPRTEMQTSTRRHARCSCPLPLRPPTSPMHGGRNAVRASPGASPRPMHCPSAHARPQAPASPSRSPPHSKRVSSDQGAPRPHQTRARALSGTRPSPHRHRRAHVPARALSRCPCRARRPRPLPKWMSWCVRQRRSDA
ncbi:hypothetical protein OH76DRAFT_1087222 [Lentinus brumalis]|uniref:Uncharacterized protein n=1 Tax=Lentinus brumalis TaxID=2498619 RepID=A0A371DPD2_9APHY|nr:hypothetical protein OH76DRAFT_1087222 [Polyporus brumalis]